MVGEGFESVRWQEVANRSERRAMGMSKREVFITITFRGGYAMGALFNSRSEDGCDSIIEGKIGDCKMQGMEMICPFTWR